MINIVTLRLKTINYKIEEWIENVCLEELYTFDWTPDVISEMAESQLKEPDKNSLSMALTSKSVFFILLTNIINLINQVVEVEATGLRSQASTQSGSA